MKTVQGIIEAHGGIEGLKRQYLRIERPGYMRLVIEYIGTGPRKLPLISVAHYGEQNGDAMRGPRHDVRGRRRFDYGALAVVAGHFP